MKRLLLSILLLSSSTLFGAAPPTLTEKDSVSNMYNLNEVVVTSTRTPLLLKDAPVITRVISARELEKTGVKTIQQALETELAGVEFHQAGFGSQMLFQGLDARYILFLVDGERMAGETYGNIDYARIPLGNVEKIEIVRGASSVLYGSNAMGAVVNIITRQPKDKVEIIASAGYAGFYQKNNKSALAGIHKYNSKLDIPNINADLIVGLNFGKLKSQTTVSYTGIDAYNLVSSEEESRFYKSLKITSMKMGSTGPSATSRVIADTTIKAPIDTAGMSISGWRNFSLNQKLDYKLSDKISFYVAGSYFNKKRYDFAESINTGSGGDKNWTNESYNSYSVKAGAEYRPNKNNVLTLSYYGDIYERNLDSLDLSIPKQKHVYNIPRLLWVLNAGKYNRVTTGLEYVNEKLNFDLNPNGYSDLKQLNTGSIYVQDEITTNLPLSFVAGVRVDNNDKFGWSVTPKASAKYTLKNFNFRANYSQGYRAPSLKELYMAYLIPMGGMGSSKTYIVGNPDLKPEYNQYISLSAEYTKGFFNISATAFKSFFKDKIDVRREVIDATTTHLVYNNIDKSQFSGIELMLRARIVKGLFVMGNYNYIYQTEEALQSSTQYIFVSPHTATLKLDYLFTVGSTDFGINLSGRYVGAKDYEDMMTIIEYPKQGPQLPTVYSGSYSAHHDAYTVWNGMVSVGFKNNITLAGGIENLFDYSPKIVNFNSGITPPRHAFVKFIFNFNSK